MENTFLYCWKRLAHKEDAKDLAQEIIVDALLALRSGKIIKNFHALYWTIANHKLCDFYHRKRPSSVHYEEVENVLLAFDTSFDDYISREELDVLSHSMARLAAIHRDIIIRFYLKDQSVKQIAQALRIPTGTVTGRLSDARKNLKETYMNREKCKKTKLGSVQIVPLRLEFYWLFDDAWCSIISLLDRQILFTCRSEKKTINEIADEVQASPVFVEESVLRMTESRVMYEPTKGKYISDFIFFPESILQKAGKIAKDTMQEMELVPRYFTILDGMKDAILAEDFYGNDFDWDYLLPWFIVRSEREFCKRYGSDYIRDKYAHNLDYRRKAEFYIRASWEDEDMVFKSHEAGKMESSYPYDSISSSKYGNCELHNTINEFDIHVKGKEYSYDGDRLSWIQAPNIDLYLDLVANPVCR